MIQYDERWSDLGLCQSVAFEGLGKADCPLTLKFASTPTENSVALGALYAIKSLEAKCRASHRVLTWTAPATKGVGIHKVDIQRRQFTADQVLTDRVAYYFDFSEFPFFSPPTHSPFVWSLASVVDLPFNLSWLQFDSASQNSRANEPLDASIFYSGNEGKAAIYVYGDCAESDGREVEREATTAFTVALRQALTAKTPWEFARIGPFYGRHFLIGPDMSYVGVTSIGGKFVKVRITFPDTDKQHREMSSAILTATIRAIEKRPTF